MALIALSGKHAVGRYSFAQVDDADLPLVSQWKWKAKPNASGNYVYAVRNTMIDGRNVTLRMHRVVLGLTSADVGVEVDHITHDTVDNRRSNLRVTDRKGNASNRRIRVRAFTCDGCGADVVSIANAFEPASTCPDCRKRQSSYRRPRQQTLLLLHCAHCGAGMTGKRIQKRFCSDVCRSKAKCNRRAPGVDERLIAALNVPCTAREAAQLAGVHESDARRALPALVRSGVLHYAEKRKGDKGWASAVYERSHKIS